MERDKRGRFVGKRREKNNNSTSNSASHMYDDHLMGRPSQISGIDVYDTGVNDMPQVSYPLPLQRSLLNHESSSFEDALRQDVAITSSIAAPMPAPGVLASPTFFEDTSAMMPQDDWTYAYSNNSAIGGAGIFGDPTAATSSRPDYHQWLHGGGSSNMGAYGNDNMRMDMTYSRLGQLINSNHT
jgi:hypothetical protein